MSFFNKIKIKLTCNKIATDYLGNTYYESKVKDMFGVKKRYVIYSGIEESSKVPPMCHGWLHYMMEDYPHMQENNFEWQKSYIPNLTGTKYAYDPAASAQYLQMHESWVPELNNEDKNETKNI